MPEHTNRRFERRFEPESGTTYYMRFICLFAKDPAVMPRLCKYFIRKGNACEFSGNWSLGLQDCKCQAAHRGLLQTIIKENDEMLKNLKDKEGE